MESVRPHKTVVVIGAGVTGLVAAYELVKKGFSVTVVETSNSLGGLAGSFLIEGNPVEKYYHFICRGDDDLIDLTRELGIEEAVHWRPASTGFFIQDRILGFSGPIDLLKFTPLTWSQRLRFGLNVLISQHRTDWQALDEYSAKDWLLKQVGPEAYQAIWDPLLRIKFGRFHSEISAAWIWHRIHRFALSEQLLRRKLVPVLRQRVFHAHRSIGVPIGRIGFIQTSQRNHSIQNRYRQNEGSRRVLAPENQLIAADAVISTVAIPRFTKLIPSLGDYSDGLERIEYLNIVCMLLHLNRRLSNNFWTNINDPRIAFNGIIELTNLNPRPDLSGTHLVYIPFYLDSADQRWSFEDEQLYDEYSAGLKLLQPEFDNSWVRNWRVSRDWHAQAICRRGFLRIMPTHETPVENLYITDSSQYYPEDRTISASVRLGRQVASLVNQRKTD